jgi:hypothetical protein
MLSLKSPQKASSVLWAVLSPGSDKGQSPAVPNNFVIPPLRVVMEFAVPCPTKVPLLVSFLLLNPYCVYGVHLRAKLKIV